MSRLLGGIIMATVLIHAGAAAPVRALLLVDEGYGANWLIQDGKPSIAGALSALGWEVDVASLSGKVDPCAWGAGKGLMPVSTLRTDAIGDIGSYDLVAVLPGRGHEGLARDPAALDAIRRAHAEGLAVAGLCRGARVLAAAGVVAGRRMTGHPDYAAEYRAAGAEYVGYSDLAKKSDAPPPVVDGNLVTAVRCNYFRAQICEALRIAAANSRAARGAAAAEPPAARTAAFAFMAARGKEKEALALASSLRTFGGALRDSRILAMVAGSADRLPADSRAALEALGVELAPYELPPALDSFPLADKVPAAAAAEARLAAEPASSRPDALVWMDSDTLVVREPSEVLLPAGARLGYRPVHHTVIGSPADSVPDAFWTAVYAACGTDPAAAFPVTAMIDRRRIRFYPNAGFLVVRPSDGLLGAWYADFAKGYELPALAALYDSDQRRQLFAHQAFLAATLLARLPPSAMRELSFAYNYPLHLHGNCPAELKPSRLEDLATMRYDRWANWPKIGPTLPPSGAALAEWVAARR